jgi:hypothetical protein
MILPLLIWDGQAIEPNIKSRLSDQIAHPHFFKNGSMRFPMTEMQLLDVQCSIYRYQRVLPAIKPATRSTTNTTIAMKNRIRAISADAAATPPKPNIAATIETTRKNKANRSMTRFHFGESTQQRYRV